MMKTLSAFKRTLLAYKRLFRIEHAAMLSFAVLFAEILAQNHFGIEFVLTLPVFISLLVPFFIEMASFSLNDWFDVKTDKENKRTDRPLVSGEILPDAALAYSATFYLLAMFFAYMLPSSAFIVAIIFAALSIAYNWKLKDLPLVGNLFIGLSMAIPFIFGNMVVQKLLLPEVLAIAAVAFVAGLGREIIKSTEDVEGDIKHRKAKTLPAVIGKKNACYFAALVYIVAAILSPLPFLYGLHANILAIGLVLLTAFAFAAMAVSVARDQSKGNLEAARKASLLALGAGLLGYAASLISL
ncbi:MAG: UbiA family prenyltransferase [Candidatus Micrarchaeota archaeon]|nr:UbiA family prenyltransferase [Candidatus Micrarchaeota archaeon]